jgi:transmembrane sensor
MDSKQFKELIERYISDECTPDEVETLRRLLDDSAQVHQLEILMDSQLGDSTISANDYPEVVNRLKRKVEKEINQEEREVKVFSGRLVRRWVAVAALFIVIATVGFVWLTKKDPGFPAADKQVSSAPVIQPGKVGAILTLADNSKIVLDSAGKGIIAVQNGSKIELRDGQLVYHANGSTNEVYNTMSTPKGRQFRIVLPDGTRAWLNAASSLRYPSAFAGKERKVEVTGEVYFEVAKNPSMPFRVKVNEDMEVIVLGTHFNINSYSNEPSINTTLLEGSVRFINGNEQTVLRPGQQAQANSRQKIKVITDVNLKRIMAWKDGVFDFNNASLQEVMRQLERWYDIEVVYEKGVPNIEFVGAMGRDLSLSDVLKGLKLSEVNFRLEGRKLIVML